MAKGESREIALATRPTVPFVLHLRVIAPVELRDQVIEALTGNPGVAHLVVHPDAARDPQGDEITADIARESANDVIAALKALGVKERGAITLDVVDTVLSTGRSAPKSVRPVTPPTRWCGTNWLGGPARNPRSTSPT